ncbi:MAG: hypothetical protein VKK04_22725 [Synechococcales bacterium]|nr:hypothetical protein [Synechococcales bacterium]
MKRLLFFVLLPLLLAQGAATAQVDVPDAAPPEELPAPLLETLVSNQPPIIPLEGTDQIQLQLVNCSWGIDCLLARLFLPASTRLDQLELEFDNPANAPAQILNTAVSVRGTLTRYPLPDAALALPPEELALPAQQITSLPLAINRFAMPPEQYVGKIYLTQADQSNRLILPVNMSVRSGPLLPLLVLLLGIILGRLFKYMEEQGGPQAQVRKKVYQLEADIREAHPGDRQILLPMLQNARKLVYRQQLEAADTQVTLLQSRLGVLKQLRTLEARLDEQQKHGESVLEDAFAKIQYTRDLIAGGQDNEATTVLNEVLQLTTAGSRGAATVDLGDMEVALRDVTVDLGRSARNVVTDLGKAAPLSPPERLSRFLVTLSGLSDQVRAEATFWFVRPLLYLVLLTGLTLTGLNTLYIETGETFGARPMADYLALLLWGLSADVASRSLSSLKGQAE